MNRMFFADGRSRPASKKPEILLTKCDKGRVALVRTANSIFRTIGLGRFCFSRRCFGRFSRNRFCFLSLVSAGPGAYERTNDDLYEDQRHGDPQDFGIIVES